MATQVIMPRMGSTVVDGMIKKWLIQDESPVSQYQALAEVSSEKVTIEIPAPAAGILHILKPAGARVPVGEPIATIQ
jgi:pyruvate/2-oxoglutarate dehydrogenase complex dihydrolipoamide acyltransferase (E2) component